VILGVRVPADLAVDRGRDLHEPAVAGSVRRTRRHGGERRRDDAGGERREGVRAGRRPTQDEGRHPRDHAVARVEGVGDRLDAVRGHAEPEGPAVGSRLTRARQHRLEQRGPDAAALVRRQHEQHREEPDVAALPRGREPHDPSVALRDEEQSGSVARRCDSSATSATGSHVAAGCPRADTWSSMATRWISARVGRSSPVASRMRVPPGPAVGPFTPPPRPRRPTRPWPRARAPPA